MSHSLFLFLVSLVCCCNGIVTRNINLGSLSFLVQWEDATDKNPFFSFNVTGPQASVMLTLKSTLGSPKATISASSMLASAPDMSLGTYAILNGAIPFQDFNNISLSSGILSVGNVTNFGPGCLSVQEFPGDRFIATLSSSGNVSSSSSEFRMTLRFAVFLVSGVYQMRQVSPFDFKLDIQLDRVGPPIFTSAPSRLAIISAWDVLPGGRGTIPTNRTNSVQDKIWDIVVKGSPSQSMDWICAVSTTVQTLTSFIQAPVFVKTALATTQSAFFFAALIDTNASAVNSILWDPQLSVVVATTTTQPDSVNVGLIVGVTIGAVVVGAGLAILIVFLTKRSATKEAAMRKAEIRQRSVTSELLVPRQ